MKHQLTVQTPNCATTKIANARDYFELQSHATEKLPYTEIDQIGEELWKAFQDRRKVFIFGNGGSASLASHLACDLGKGTVSPGSAEKRFRVLALTDNLALLTALANDLSYEHVFAEQLRNLLEPGDLAMAISASGNSKNVLTA